MKITDYPINNDPNPETEYVVCAYSGQNYKILTGNLNFFSPRNKMIPRISDFMNLNTSVFEPRVTPTLSTENNHPGIINVDTNLRYHQTQYVFIGGEVIVGTFKTDIPTNGSEFGLFNAIGEGVWIDITIAGLLRGVVDGSSATPTYTVIANTWYSFKVIVNSTKTEVDFYLYNTSGELLWTANKIATPSNLSFDPLIAGANTIVDWIAFYNNTELVR